MWQRSPAMRTRLSTASSTETVENSLKLNVPQFLLHFLQQL